MEVKVILGLELTESDELFEGNSGRDPRRFQPVIGRGNPTAPIPEMWLRQHTAGLQNDHTSKPTPMHFSFRVSDWKLVGESHAAAIAAGDTDNKPVGERHWMKGNYGIPLVEPLRTCSCVVNPPIYSCLCHRFG